MPGAFKLDHMQPVKPILFPKFYNFFTFILGCQFLLPQRANNEKREFSQLQKWMTQRGLGAWDIQTEPFAAPQAHFGWEIFQLFHFHAWEANQTAQKRRALEVTSAIFAILMTKLRLSC